MIDRAYVRRALRRSLPPAVEKLLLDAYVDLRERSRLREYATFLTSMSRRAGHSRAPKERILIVAPDPYYLIGSRGDEAMIRSVIETALGGQPRGHGILVASSLGGGVASSLGLEPFEIAGANDFPSRYLELLATERFSAVAAIGADTLDGFYSTSFAGEMLFAVSAAARLGLRAGLIGFSFNEQPSPKLKKLFDGIPPEVQVSLRDPLSLRRLRTYSQIECRLTADCAFLLQPSAPSLDVKRWLGEQRKLGRFLLGVNVTTISSEERDPLVAAIRSQYGKRNLSVVLISHDDRPAASDAVALDAVHTSLTQFMPDNVLYLRQPSTAAAIKGAAGMLDAVVTSRMHLAIAALGSGVPTLSLAYQGKFEGLYELFGLSESLIIPAGSAPQSSVMEEALDRLLRDAGSLKGTVASKLPAVMELARANFEFLEERSLAPALNRVH